MIGLVLCFGQGCSGDGRESGASGDPVATLSPRKGRWREYRIPGKERSDLERETIERLESIGYLSGSRPAPAGAGVLVHDPGRSQAGLNFFTSGHGPRAFLMTMDGRILHEWHREFEEVWPEYPGVENVKDTEFWRRAHLYENGDILAIFEGLGLIKLDRDSRLLWAYAGRAHHDLHVLPDGSIWTLTRKAHVSPESGIKVPILEDFAVHLDAEGRELRRLSLLACFQGADEDHSWARAYRDFWSRNAGSDEFEREDLFHTNSIEVLDGRLESRLPAFRAGNLLVSLGHLDMIAVVDVGEEQVVWSARGPFRLQHDAQVLDDGTLMLFDNAWRPGRSAATIYDPVTLEPVWRYAGTLERILHSRTCGAVQRLANGNVLVTESDNGRALEVTPDQTVVWEYVSPFRAGRDDEFIATLFDLHRLPEAFPAAWIPGEGDEGRPPE